MADFNRYSSQNYAPSAPVLPESYGQESTSESHRYHGQQSSVSPHPQHFSHPSSYEYSSVPQYGGYFPPGTHPEIIRSFQMVDSDRSGFIDELELQRALSSGYQNFSLRTIQFLMFLFKNPKEPLKIGPSEFAALWSCLGQWRAIFQSFDRDRSGKMDSMELKDALYSLGYAVPPSVLQVLISKYDDGSGRRVELNFDSFVECGMIIKGLTEKFKEKDKNYTGTATLAYDTFMSMVIPFIVP
ncbi:probable calcium-binding protein CML48 [Macadamia integrifolia]|uniref:probable calcium-binding protein CML48 n=1 Tax=Macadamia integrifolia TaxID=60698 RepID=UPI001C52A8B0|nr:probable calcium-binding protein CML48 [Macadamia integrifolia]XP_042475792.1 probable calcium-binding protein CML48 [Macadamia integrifolia]